MEYLKLKFKDSGFFENNNQNVSVSVKQLSNVLHVLFGERPSPSYRRTVLPIIGEIYDMTSKGYIKIETPKVKQYGKTKYNKKIFYNREFIQTNKNVFNSYKDKNRCFITWEILKIYLSDELFNKTISVFEKVLGYECKSKTAMNVIDEIIHIMSKNSYVIDILSKVNDYEKSKTLKINTNKISLTAIYKAIESDNELLLLCKELASNGKTPFAKLLFGIEKDSAINKISDLRILTTNVRGAESNYRKISGELIIPITDWGVEKLKKSMGVAKLLDGGVVWIEDLVDEDDLSMIDLFGFVEINKLEEYENNN